MNFTFQNPFAGCESQYLDVNPGMAQESNNINNNSYQNPNNAHELLYNASYLMNSGPIGLQPFNQLNTQSIEGQYTNEAGDFNQTINLEAENMQPNFSLQQSPYAYVGPSDAGEIGAPSRLPSSLSLSQNNMLRNERAQDGNFQARYCFPCPGCVKCAKIIERAVCAEIIEHAVRAGLPYPTPQAFQNGIPICEAFNQAFNTLHTNSQTTSNQQQMADMFAQPTQSPFQQTDANETRNAGDHHNVAATMANPLHQGLVEDQNHGITYTKQFHVRNISLDSIDVFKNNHFSLTDDSPNALRDAYYSAPRKEFRGKSKLHFMESQVKRSTVEVDRLNKQNSKLETFVTSLKTQKENLQNLANKTQVEKNRCEKSYLEQIETLQAQIKLLEEQGKKDQATIKELETSNGYAETIQLQNKMIAALEGFNTRKRQLGYSRRTYECEEFMELLPMVYDERGRLRTVPFALHDSSVNLSETPLDEASNSASKKRKSHTLTDDNQATPGLITWVEPTPLAPVAVEDLTPTEQAPREAVTLMDGESPMKRQRKQFQELPRPPCPPREQQFKKPMRPRGPHARREMTEEQNRNEEATQARETSSETGRENKPLAPVAAANRVDTEESEEE